MVVSMAGSTWASEIRPTLPLAACGMHDRANDREMPCDRNAAAEDTRLLAALDQRGELLEDRQVAAVQLLRREPVRVDREQSVEPAEFLPGGTEHALQRFRRLTALRLGIARRLSDLRHRVLHDSVEEDMTI